MAASISKYNHLGELLCNGLLDFGGTLKVMLVTSAYTFSATHEYVDSGTNNSADPSFNELVDASYARVTLAGVDISQAGAVATVDAENTVFSTLTGTFRGAIIYLDDGVGDISSPLLFYILLDTTPADIVVAAQDFLIAWNASGITTVT